MTENKISTEDITAALEKVVTERGEDYFYPKNDQGMYAYTNSDGTPSCIVGCVLAEVAPEFLEKIHNVEFEDGTFLDSFFFKASGVTVLSLKPPMTSDQIHMLGVAQEVQDNRKSWGEALKAYKQELEERA